MNLGGIKFNSKPRVFLLSTTHGAESAGLAAGKAVIKFYKKMPVIKHNKNIIKKINLYINKILAKMLKNRGFPMGKVVFFTYFSIGK